MTWQPVPLPDGTYRDSSKPFSAQDVVNYWVEYAEGEGTRNPKKLVQLPGLRAFSVFGAGPHRGIHDAEGNLFVVSDTHAYQVSEDGETVTQLGIVPGRGRVWIAHNQITNGYQVMFSTGPDAWIWDTVEETWTKVTDEAFRGARSLVYLNSRFLGIEPLGRFFANSALADGLSWDSIERYESESSPDRLVALVVIAGEIVALNKSTLEFFQNTTNPTDIENHILFTRVGPPVQVGGASSHGVSTLDNRVFFVGSDGGGYYLNGYSPVRITTPAIETAWQACDLSKCFCFTYESRGHAIWYVTFPDGETWGYDCLSSARKGAPVWHRRQSLGLSRWRLNTLTKWNGRWIGGSYNSGVLYEVDWDYEGLEGCDEIVREFVPGVLHDEGNRVTLNGLRIECDTGNETTSCVEVETVVPVSSSPDFIYPANNYPTAVSYWNVDPVSFAVTNGPALGTGNYPVVNPDNTRLYFGNLDDGVDARVGYVTLATGAGTLFSSSATGPCVIDLTETYLYYGEANSSTLYQIRISDGTEVDNWTMEIGGNLVMTNDGSTLYSSTYVNGDEVLIKFDIATTTTTEYTITDRQQSRGLALSLDESLAFITCVDGGGANPRVVAINLSDGTKSHEWAIPDVGGVLAVSRDGEVAVQHFSAVTGTIWVYSSTGTLHYTLSGTSDFNASLNYNATGDRLYHVAHGGLTCFDVRNNYAEIGFAVLPDEALGLAIYPPYPQPEWP